LRDFLELVVNGLYGPQFQGLFLCCRKGDNWPTFFPQKNPQAVDKPVDNSGLY